MFGTRLRCFGEVRAGYQGLEMIHPSYRRILSAADEAVSDRLTPVYPNLEGLGQATWIKLTEQALAQMADDRLELEELLPPEVPGLGQLPTLQQSLTYIHRPPAGADVAARGGAWARRGAGRRSAIPRTKRALACIHGTESSRRGRDEPDDATKVLDAGRDLPWCECPAFVHSAQGDEPT